MNPIKILLVDDNALLRESFKRTLNNIDITRVVGECSDGNEVIPFLELNKVDVIFMDGIMKHMDGIAATRIVKENYPGIKVIGFSSADHTLLFKAMQKSGVDGFISKFDVNRKLVIEELKKVMQLD